MPAGSVLTFAYGGKRLDSLDVSEQPMGRENWMGKRAGKSVYETDHLSKQYRLWARLSGNRARIIAELPAGEYAVSAFARMPQGDALYGFRLAVE